MITVTFNRKEIFEYYRLVEGTIIDHNEPGEFCYQGFFMHDVDKLVADVSEYGEITGYMVYQDIGGQKTLYDTDIKGFHKHPFWTDLIRTVSDKLHVNQYKED